MERKKYILTLLLSSVSFLSACSDNGILFRSVGSYDVSERKGVYMIEKPYEIDGRTFTPKEDYNYFDSGDAFWYAYDKNKPFTANGERTDAKKFTAIHRTLPLPSIVRITNLNNDMSVLVRVNDRGPSDTSRLIDVSQSVAEYLNFSKDTVTPVQVEVMVVESKALKEELLSEQTSKTTFEHNFKTEKKSSVQGEVSVNADEILYPGMSQEHIQNLKVSPSGSVQKTVQKSTNKIETNISSQYSDNDIVYSGKDIGTYYIQVGAFSQQKSVNQIRQKLKEFDNLFIQNKMSNNILLHHVRLGPFDSRKDAQKTLDKIHRSGYPESKIIQE